MKTIKKLLYKILGSAGIKAKAAAVINLLFGRVARSTNDSVSILIPAPGGGNIGDQAMLESFLHNIDGKKLIIKTQPIALDIPSHYAVNVEVIEMPGLIYGHLFRFLRDYVRLRKIMASASALYVVGADIMDGGYNKNASIMRSKIATYFARNNIPSRVFGFSWNGNPDAAALSAIRNAAANGVLLCARDPLSFQRLQDAGVPNIRLVADMVFANDNTKSAGIEDILQFCAGKQIALVNASGLIGKNIDQIDEYSKVINKLMDHNFNIVLLPHVIRHGANDLPICQALSGKYPNAFLVNRLLEPDQVKRLAQEAKIVVTGRMHLSIMSLNQNVPSIVLSTQGKVDGLMQFFETEKLSINPEKGFSDLICSQIDFICSNRQYYQDLIRKNLLKVKELAAGNFN
ncbi:polysaccharide pyruvyl transferase family protein [Methylobacillus glycogenes]|uniref:polysaccharide pyruvyl transferase family protein n=1 Tax=Methylobacillus glycogenes TaxID=406 RepID=UPI000472122E|nr:polysaccharide pyruvyl transferase family protein [Methylobacillus glycogenes]